MAMKQVEMSKKYEQRAVKKFLNTEGVCDNEIHKRMRKAGNTLEAEARWSVASSVCLVLKNVFQFLCSAACSIHTAHEEGNS